MKLRPSLGSDLVQGLIAHAYERARYVKASTRDIWPESHRVISSCIERESMTHDTFTLASALRIAQRQLADLRADSVHLKANLNSLLSTGEYSHDTYVLIKAILLSLEPKTF